jgi:hypothetical protein
VRGGARAVRPANIARVWRAKLLLAALILAPTSLLNAAEPPEALAPIAHSALVTLEGARTATGLTLRVRANGAGAPLNISEIAVTLDGRPQTVTARADGSFDVALTAAARTGAGQLEVTVAHDGIREALSAHVALGAATPAGSAAGSASRKQLWWWALNIGIVLVAAVAISRRMS